MAGPDRRLDALFPALTAVERGRLVLQAWKEECDEDPRVRSTIPPQQIDHFNRLIARMNAINHDVAILLIVIELHVEQLDLRFAWLVTSQLWAMQTEEIREYLYFHGTETITESEFARKQGEARKKFIPIDDLVEFLVERSTDWQVDAANCENPDQATEAAWDRVYAEKQCELVQLVQSKRVSGKRTRSGYVIEQGSFYNWLGEPTPATPDWGQHYTVLPDAQADLVRSEAAARERLREKLDQGPQGMDGQALDDEDASGTWEVIPTSLARSVRAGILGEWLQVRAIELVIEEVAAEFGGEDPAKPKVRTTLRRVKAKLEDLYKSYSEFVAPLELIEPDEEELEQMREYLKWAEERL